MFTVDFSAVGGSVVQAQSLATDVPSVRDIPRDRPSEAAALAALYASAYGAEAASKALGSSNATVQMLNARNVARTARESSAAIRTMRKGLAMVGLLVGMLVPVGLEGVDHISAEVEEAL